MKKHVFILSSIFVGLMLASTACREEVSITESKDVEIKVGEERTLHCLVTHGKVENIQWSSSSEENVTIEGNQSAATIKGIKEGSSIITAGAKASDQVTVNVDTYYRNSKADGLYHGDTAIIMTRSGYILEMAIENEYHAEIIGSSNKESEFFEKTIEIQANYVGKTNLQLFSNDRIVDKSFEIEVKPHYLTYEEPDFEYGDTQSAITQKFGIPSQISFTSDGSLVFNYLSYSTSNRLSVFFDKEQNNEVVDFIALLFTDKEQKEEIPLFLEERYPRFFIFYYNSIEIILNLSKNFETE